MTPGANRPWLMESDAVNQPLDDAGLFEARPADPPGASTVSDCGAAIVTPSRSAGRPHVEQNRAPSERFAPQVGQATAGFYLAFRLHRVGIRDPGSGIRDARSGIRGAARNR